MTGDAWLTLAVVTATVVVLVSERVSPSIAIVGAVTALLVAGVIDDDQALSGFANPAPATVAALYVVAGAVEASGSLEGLSRRVLGSDRGGSRATRAELGRLLLPIASASAFLNNTPIVGMAAPRVAAWARRTGRSPAQYLMPLSFATILGGLITLIGTSTNVVVAGLIEDAGMKSLGFFEITRAGLPIAVIGVAVLIAVAPRLLPDRTTAQDSLPANAREFTIEMLLPPRSPLAGTTVADAGLRNLQGVFLVEIERAGHILAPVPPDEVLEEDDRLTFAGNVTRVLDLQRLDGLVPAEHRHFAIAGGGRRFFEAVVGTTSPLLGSTLKEIGFRSRYGGAVVAVHWAGERLPGKLGEVSMRAGDVLLVLGDDTFGQRWRDHHDFLVVSPIEGEMPVRREKARLVQAIVLALILLAGTGAVDILQGALLAAIAVVAFGVLSPAEARDAIDLDIIVVIAASFGLGQAISGSGLAADLGDLLVDGFEGLGDTGLLVGILVATTVLTALISNNASAVLMFPIAVETALRAGLDPRPFVIAVMVAASVDFLTPIGYQTNTMVYGIGGYHFTDFGRVGFPLTITTLVAASVLIPIGWSLS